MRPMPESILHNRGQEMQVPDDRKATVVFRQFPQSLQKGGRISREKLGVAFYPDILDPCFLQDRPKDGSIKAEAEILISLTWPAGSAFRRKERSASTPIVEKSKMARLPVRCAIWDTGGMISSGRQTKAMMGTRCSATSPDLHCNSRRYRDAE